MLYRQSSAVLETVVSVHCECTFENEKRTCGVDTRNDEYLHKSLKDSFLIPPDERIEVTMWDDMSDDWVTLGSSSEIMAADQLKVKKLPKSQEELLAQAQRETAIEQERAAIAQLQEEEGQLVAQRWPEK